eukprot:364215-Chlamydomonas_euryale.AAC.5
MTPQCSGAWQGRQGAAMRKTLKEGRLPDATEVTPTGQTPVSGGNSSRLTMQHAERRRDRRAATARPEPTARKWDELTLVGD